MQEQPKPLNPLYFETWFICEISQVPNTFSIITASNPNGRTQSDSNNQDARERLHKKLTAMGLTPFRVDGGSKDRAHIEEGYGVECSLDCALMLCNEFEQDAILRVENGSVFIVDRTGSGKHFMAPWLERQID